MCVCRHACLCLCFGVSSGEEVLTGLVGVCADIYVFVFWSVQWEEVLAGFVGVCVCVLTYMCLCFGVSSGEEVLAGLVSWCVCVRTYMCLCFGVSSGEEVSWVS